MKNRIIAGNTRTIGGIVTDIIGDRILFSVKSSDVRLSPSELAVGDEPTFNLPIPHAPVEAWDKWPRFLWDHMDIKKTIEVGQKVYLQIEIVGAKLAARCWVEAEVYEACLAEIRQNFKANPVRKQRHQEETHEVLPDLIYRFYPKKAKKNGDHVTGTAQEILTQCYHYFEDTMSGWRSGQWKVHNGRGFEDSAPPKFPGKNPFLEERFGKKGAA